MRTSICTAVSLETLYKISGQTESCFGTGARGTWQAMSFTYFASSSPLKLYRHSSFNLARNTCSFCWCYIFSSEYS